LGKVVLLEEYDMAIGRALTSGCDVWLNTPLRPHEASGTSGMKGPLNGGINCSIADGWWPECADGRNGWTIEAGKVCKTPEAQDKADAEALYRLLEEELVPEFYDRDRKGLPRKWLKRALRVQHRSDARGVPRLGVPRGGAGLRFDRGGSFESRPQAVETVASIHRMKP
ncbi:MAG: hypothetical protein RJA16_1477, partial [Planctomycetota bacterium]